MRLDAVLNDTDYAARLAEFRALLAHEPAAAA
jgi:hypothetical protein